MALFNVNMLGVRARIITHHSVLLEQTETTSTWLIKEGEGGGVWGDYSRKAFILNQEPITPVSN